MQDLDFLPQRYREARLQRKTRTWRAGVLVGFAGLVCAAIIGQYTIRQATERDLTVVRELYRAYEAQKQRLATLEQQLAPERARADLLTYLRHPWPRTRIVSSVVGPLPDCVALSKLHIHREEPARVVAAAPAVSTSENPAAAAPDKSPLAARDLKKLREDIDARLAIVTLEGTTSDDATLHEYLGQLADNSLFATVELTSIERGEDRQAAAVRFSARLVVRPGFGQRGGPTAPAAAPTDIAPNRVVFSPREARP